MTHPVTVGRYAALPRAARTPDRPGRRRRLRQDHPGAPDRYAVCQYASLRARSAAPTAERRARLAYRLFPPAALPASVVPEPPGRARIRTTVLAGGPLLAGAAALGYQLADAF